MAKKKEISEEIKLLKSKIQEGKVIIGSDRVIKNLKSKGLEKVYLASNCPENVKKDIIYYAELAKIPVENLEMDNEEFGIFCKKNHFISALGTL